jgi:hypothetical protein
MQDDQLLATVLKSEAETGVKCLLSLHDLGDKKGNKNKAEGKK